MSDNYNGASGPAGPATKTGPSSNSWLLIMVLVLVLIGLGVFTFHGRYRSYEEERDRLRDLISETVIDSVRTDNLERDIVKNRSVLTDKIRELSSKGYPPDPPDFTKMREHLKDYADRDGYKISEFRATGHETEGAVTRTTLLLTYSGLPDFEEVKESFHSGPHGFLIEWELVGQTATSVSLKGVAHSIATPPGEECNAEAVQCGQFKSDVRIPAYADEIKELITKYKNTCPEISPEKARDLKNEMCRIENRIKQTREKIKFADKTILEIEAREIALQKRKKAERLASIRCDPEQAVPYDRKIHEKYDTNEIIFCAKKGKGRAIVAMPGKVNIIVKKGDDLCEHSCEVTAVENDHISCRKIYLDPANPDDTYIFDYDIHDEIGKLVERSSVVTREKNQ